MPVYRRNWLLAVRGCVAWAWLRGGVVPPSALIMRAVAGVLLWRVGATQAAGGRLAHHFVGGSSLIRKPIPPADDAVPARARARRRCCSCHRARWGRRPARRVRRRGGTRRRTRWMGVRRRGLSRANLWRHHPRRDETSVGTSCHLTGATPIRRRNRRQQDSKSISRRSLHERVFSQHKAAGSSREVRGKEE